MEILKNALVRAALKKFFKTTVKDGNLHGVYLSLNGDDIEVRYCTEDPKAEIERLKKIIYNS